MIGVLVVIIGMALSWPKEARAVLPPDFIFNVWTQVFQMFSIMILFLSTSLGVGWRFIKVKLGGMKHKGWVMIGGIMLIIGLSFLTAWAWGNYRQRQEYDKWMEESKKYSQGIVEVSPLPTLVPTPVALPTTAEDEVVVKFIKNYYGLIEARKYEEAYEISKKAVDLETFKGWYKKTTKISVDKVIRIDESKSSLELSLFENDGKMIRYGVLMTVKMEGGNPIRVEKSEVKILDERIEGGAIPTVIPNSFWERNKNTKEIVSNSEFKQKTERDKKDLVIIDAREDMEYENGRYPDSIHIRWADLRAGRWIELPQDKYIVVICWSGIRGKEVAEFLRSQKLVASYLENGANGWVGEGGEWIGGIKFSDKYSEERYVKVFSTQEVKKMAEEGVKLVDCREPSKFEEKKIKGSVSIPIMYTPSIKMEEVLGQVPKGSRVVTICDGYVNCFDAKITGAELEKRGHQFLGRYNRPWEYAN